MQVLLGSGTIVCGSPWMPSDRYGVETDFSSRRTAPAVVDPVTTALTSWVARQFAQTTVAAIRRQRQRDHDAAPVRAALLEAVRLGVHDALADAFPDDIEQQNLVRALLFERGSDEWPLVDGGYPADLPGSVRDWVGWIESPPSEDGHPELIDADHQFVVQLCVAILGRVRREALRGNQVLSAMWLEFKAESGIDDATASHTARGKSNGPGSVTWFEGSVGNIVQAQHIDTVHANHGAASAVPPHSFADGPLLHGRIPSLAAARQRREIDAVLAEAFDAGNTSGPCRVLSGMGGVGKTQLAAELARRCWDDGKIDLLLWVNATSRESIISGFAQAGVASCGTDPADSGQAAQTFLNWLDRPDAPRWLIVLDDLTDPTDIHGLWPPTRPPGRTLVTTRRRDAALDGEGRSRTDVDLFTPDEAVSYLNNRLDRNSRLLDGAANLAAELGYLPLALAQAAAYILDQPGLTCNGYLQLLNDRAIKLAELTSDAIPDGYRASVAATWSLSIDLADAYEPRGLATMLLQVTSLLDPAGISAELFTTESIRNYSIEILTDSANQGSTSDLSAREVNTMLGRMHRLSLIDFDGHDVYVHSLIQRSVRDQLSPDDRDNISYAAADALEEIWPHPETDLVASASLRSNTAQLRSHAEAALCSPDTHTVLFLAGNSLGNTGQVAEAAAYFERLLGVCEGVFGSDHPDALSARNFIAAWQGRTGDASGAVAALEALLTDWMRVFGPDDRSTLNLRHNLAVWRGQAGDAAGAAAALASLLADRLRAPGSEPAELLAARHDLAHWNGRAGDIAGAVAAFREVFTDCLKILGPDDPRTLMTRDNLGSLQGKAGDATGAVRTYEKLLADRKRVLGSDHPETLATRGHLASWHGKAGDAIKAVICHEELLADRMRVLGPGHPDTVSTKQNLAYWKGQAGDAVAAANDYAAVLDDCIRVFGPNHPHTLETRGNLAVWRGESGDASGAAEACEALLFEFNRIMGPDHPETLATRGNLAHWRGESGDAAGAVSAFKALLEDMVRVLGPDHPDTLTVRNNLAFRQGETGDAAGAVASFQVILKDRLRVLGPDHPHIHAAQINLEHWRTQLNQADDD
jgi:hypothetical protein